MAIQADPIEKLKYIKTNKDFISNLQDFILDNSNAGLISISIHFSCMEFIRELEKIPLSEELQSFNEELNIN